MKPEYCLINKLFKTNIGNLFIKKELGKGKSGYSYLAEFEHQSFVLKLMHNEPCPYYHFGNKNKVLLETNAYYKLRNSNILIPELLDYNAEKNYLVKEFIDGYTASELIASDRITESTLEQLFKMYYQARAADINIDYFPSNFIIMDKQLFYIDYECNPFNPEWDLLHWGIYYWANTQGFKEYLNNCNISAINKSPETGIPIKKPFEERVSEWIKRYEKID